MPDDIYPAAWPSAMLALLPTSKLQAKALGKRKFFTGIPCVKAGHLAPRYVSGSKCVSCSLIRARIQWPTRPKKKWIRQPNPPKPPRHTPPMTPERAKYLEGKRRQYVKHRANWLPKLKARKRHRRKDCGSYTTTDITEIRGLQKNRCAACKISFKKTPEQIDHIIPVTKGGMSDRRNLQLLCEPCNRRKHNHDPIVWAQTILGLLV